MKPVTQINVFSIKADKIDEFYAVDRSYITSIDRPKGLIASRLYRSLEGHSAVRVTQYESAEALKESLQSDNLRQQINRLRPFVESSSPDLYEEVHTTGNFK
jgi:quinol monooxygenase YgiN